MISSSAPFSPNFGADEYENLITFPHFVWEFLLYNYRSIYLLCKTNFCPFFLFFSEVDIHHHRSNLVFVFMIGYSCCLRKHRNCLLAYSHEINAPQNISNEYGCLHIQISVCVTFIYKNIILFCKFLFSIIIKNLC